MKFVDEIHQILTKPFPEQESNFGAPKTIALVSGFVIFFLFVFQPFGISDLTTNKFFICLGFGLMTFSATVIFEFMVGPVLNLKGKLENWTFGKWILNNLGIMASISLANFLFARLVIFGYVDWQFYPQMIYATFMIGLIPIIVTYAKFNY